MSEQCLPTNNDATLQPLNQFLINPDDPTDAAQVTISTYVIGMTQPSSSAAINSKLQLNHNTHNVSPTSNFYSPPSGPNPLEFRLVSTEGGSPLPPMP